MIKLFILVEGGKRQPHTVSPSGRGICCGDNESASAVTWWQVKAGLKQSQSVTPPKNGNNSKDKAPLWHSPAKQKDADDLLDSEWRQGMGSMVGGWQNVMEEFNVYYTHITLYSTLIYCHRTLSLSAWLVLVDFMRHITFLWRQI